VQLLVSADKAAPLGEYRIFVTGTPETGESTSTVFTVKVVTPYFISHCFEPLARSFGHGVGIARGLPHTVKRIQETGYETSNFNCDDHERH